MSDKTIKRSILVIAAMTSFIAPFMISAVNIALPAIQKTFSVSAIVLSWVTTSSILSTAVILVPTGKLADIYGRKKFYIWGIIIFTLSSFLCAFAGFIELFIAFRIIQGIGGAMIITTGMAIVISVFPPQERGKAIGINTASIYLGLSAGPFIGGLITHNFRWEAIFFVTGLMGVIAITLSILFLKGEWADAKGEKFDIAGSIIYGVSLVFIMYGVSLLPATRAFLFIVPGIIGFFLFVKHEMKIEYPVFEVRLFKHNKVFTFSSLAALINYAATYAITFLLSLYLQYIMGLSPQLAGTILAVQPIMQAIVSPLAGKLSDRIEPAIIASVGMGLTAIGLFSLVFLQPDTSLVFVIAILILLGLGFALFSSPNTNAIMSSVEKKYYGVASGAVGTMRTVGMTFSMAIATILFAIFIGKAEISPDTYPAFSKSVKIAFIIFTVLSAIGIYFSSVRGKLNRNNGNI